MRGLIAVLAVTAAAACSGGNAMPALRDIRSMATLRLRADASARADAIAAALGTGHAVVGERRADTCRFSRRRRVDGAHAPRVLQLRIDLAVALRGTDGRAALTEGAALLGALSCLASLLFQPATPLAPGEGEAGGPGSRIGAAHAVLWLGATEVSVEAIRVDTRQVNVPEDAVPRQHVLRADPPISIEALRAAAPLGRRYRLVGPLDTRHLKIESPE